MISESELDRAFDERFPPEVKRRLRQARVAVAGLGGLGSHVAIQLARSGIGELLLVDFDSVDISNLNRQAYGVSQLGKPKTEAIRELLAEINPYLKLRTECVRVTPQNAVDLFGDYPIVCEAFDRPENKAMLISVLLANCPFVKIVAGSGLAGYGDSNGIRTVQRMSRLFLCGDGHSEPRPLAGLMAPRVAICAGHQANMILQLILQGI